MTTAFEQFTADVMRDTRLNPDYFAQSVTYRTAAGDERSITAHVRHDVRLKNDTDTNEEQVIEQIHVELDRAEVPDAPDYGDRVLLAGEDQAYLYAYKGRHRDVSWKATFERRRMTAQGV
jgi:hypothetical protein